MYGRIGPSCMYLVMERSNIKIDSLCNSYIILRNGSTVFP